MTDTEQSPPDPELPDTPLTVGQVRARLDGLPDDAPVFVPVPPQRFGTDLPVLDVWHSRAIPWAQPDWREAFESPIADSVRVGAEFRLGDDVTEAVRLVTQAERDGTHTHTERPEFRVTFGNQYARVPHPTFAWAHPDGWLTIVADGDEHARECAVALLGPYWAGLYDATTHHAAGDEQYYPRGELLRVIVPPRAGAVSADTGDAEAEIEAALAAVLTAGKVADLRLLAQGACQSGSLDHGPWLVGALLAEHTPDHVRVRLTPKGRRVLAHIEAGS